MRVFRSAQQRDRWLVLIKCQPCPHCKCTGTLNNELWTFLVNAAQTGNRKQAFEPFKDAMSPSAPYRIWKRFLNAISTIRTKLCAICKPPRAEPPNGLSEDQTIAWATAEHLAHAFKEDDLGPIAAFQCHHQQQFF